VYSTEWGEGDVGVVVYPWEVSVGRLHQQDSAMNLIEGEIRSLVAVGNRFRVRVGPITAEVTASSADKLELARGGSAFATFKATGTRLIPLA
jgi:molybdopterin-binding protein